MILRKRQLVTAALVMALGAAIFVNRYYTKPQAEVAPAQGSVTQAAENLGDAQYVLSGTVGKTDRLAEARLKRQKAQAQAMEALQAALKDTAATEAATVQASTALAALTKQIALEADMETLIEAKTGLRALVILGTDSADILLADSPSEGSVMVQISEIAATKTGLDTEKITIVEAGSAS